MYGSKKLLLAGWLWSGSLFVRTGWTLNTTTSNSVTAPSLAPADCHCGFLDPTSDLVYTDSIIVYFNETTTVPPDIFSVGNFEHLYEKGWSLFYREGAVPTNVYFEEGSEWNLSPGWLNLNVSGYTAQHLVNGAQLQTVRQDIQYGTFRAFMRSPAPYAGGSALTMRLQHNDTSSAELDLLNMDDSADDACMQTSISGQDPETSWGLNYTVLEEAQHNIGPWDFWRWRMDWGRESISWYIGENAGEWKVRIVPTSDASLVDVPTSFYLKHWSTGDANFMQGPPQNDSTASVGWVRLFFNSSVQSTSQINSTACDGSMMCSTEDINLRLSTAYNSESAISREPPAWAAPQQSRTTGIALMAASLAFGLALIAYGTVKRRFNPRTLDRSIVFAGPKRQEILTSPWLSTDRLSKSQTPPRGFTSQADFELEIFERAERPAKVMGTGEEVYTGFLGEHGRSISERALLHYDSTAVNSTIAFTGGYVAGGLNILNTAGSRQEPPPSRQLGHGNVSVEQLVSPLTLADASATELRRLGATVEAKPEGFPVTANPGARPTAPVAVPQQRTRVDYLAGLVALCSLLVSCEHFILTYNPAVVMEYLPQHYASEYWARRTIEPFFFNEVWVGLFFTTSTRFLTSGYLRAGNLKTIAEKVVCRCPRLMIPITAVILFEYFLMDVGAVKYLEYIPSLSWSTWPSTVVFPNFGYFFDETLQMFYLIPNAAPQITWNYCTGVLWTIPVQLQNSWLVLLGVVIIREIKTPWKRFGYYAFCIINHWYALSWGSYFWFGLLLADLDITFKYRKFIHARWWVHYPMLTLAALLVWLSLANDLFSIWTGYTFSTHERGIHPEVESALPLAQTADAGYPPYTEPKLNGLVFAVGSQYVVELSTWVQAALSTRVFLWLFPHVFTIYLVHGLVWWSIGSVVCVFFAGQGLAYWLNILLTVIICYTTLFLSLPIITPAIEMLGKEVTKSIWLGASEEPAPKRPTSYPFSIEEIRALVYRRDDDHEMRNEHGTNDSPR